MIRGQVFVYKYLVVFNSFENICHQSSFIYIQNILPLIVQQLLSIFHKMLVGHMQPFAFSFPFLFVEVNCLDH